ncbi:MAG: RluA family pseudouridine synthase [Phycisphaerae bacterium]
MARSERTVPGGKPTRRGGRASGPSSPAPEVRPVEASPPRVVEPRVLFIDAALAVIDKPAGLLSAPGRQGEPCVAEWLAERRVVPDAAGLFNAHRLDRDASGLLLFARTRDALRHLVRQFEERRVEKVYWALVAGRVDRDGEIDKPIRNHPDGTHAMVSESGGKAALTRYTVLERFAGHSLLECRPVTGRLHQIRVHLAAIGHPLAVDPLYGSPQGLFLSAIKRDYRPSRRHAERALVDRLTLHARSIALAHPVSGAAVSFEAEPPKDLRAAIFQLRRWGAA